MAKKASVTISLEYDADELRFMLDEQFPDEQFREVVEDRIYEDLRNYLMGYAVSEFAKIVIEE